MQAQVKRYFGILKNILKTTKKGFEDALFIQHIYSNAYMNKILQKLT